MCRWVQLDTSQVDWTITQFFQDKDRMMSARRLYESNSMRTGVPRLYYARPDDSISAVSKVATPTTYSAVSGSFFSTFVFLIVLYIF